VPAAVETTQAVTGFAAGVGEGGKGNGRIVKRTSRLVVEQVNLRHHRNGGEVPRGRRLLFAGHAFLCMTPFAFGFVDLDTAEVGREIDDVHLPAATRVGTGERFMLERLNESPMSFHLLLVFHLCSSSFTTICFFLSKVHTGIRS
jgi:hypothetical protein